MMSITKILSFFIKSKLTKQEKNSLSLYHNFKGCDFKAIELIESLSMLSCFVSEWFGLVGLREIIFAQNN